MQLRGATSLERRVYATCVRVEQEMAAGELATTIVTVLSEAGEELQRLRAPLAGRVTDARVFGQEAPGDDDEAE